MGSDPHSLVARSRSVGANTRRLAKRLRKRDDDALREVYDTYGGVVFGFLLQMLDDRPAAEDVQQQVFLEVWQRAADYEPRRAGLLTWILMIARSRAIDQLRRRIPEPRDPAGGVALLDAAADGDHVDELIEHWRMAQMLRRLPNEEAELLRRRFYDDRSQSEIAAELGIPLGTVKSRMVNGLHRLRAELEGEER
jgi:RNA polymerase sigma-70 factor (ECF subfamily)